MTWADLWIILIMLIWPGFPVAWVIRGLWRTWCRERDGVRVGFEVKI